VRGVMVPVEVRRVPSRSVATMRGEITVLTPAIIPGRARA
jgi:hypothetical protein